VRGHNALVEGVGELITPIPLPEALLATPLALLKPPVAIPTSAIFGSPELKRNTGHAIVDVFLAEPKRFGRNDLQPPAEAYSSQVGQALGIMQNHFGNSRMSGSGSTVFSWMDLQPEATSGANNPSTFDAAQVGLNEPGWVGRVARGLARHPLLDLLDPIA